MACSALVANTSAPGSQGDTLAPCVWLRMGGHRSPAYSHAGGLPAKQETLMNAPLVRPSFRWEDPLLFEEQLTGEERMVRDSARAYCQVKLMPRGLLAHRLERFDREVFVEMGALGFLGSTLEGYGCTGVQHHCYRFIPPQLQPRHSH